jgi:hypothetical protein
MPEMDFEWAAAKAATNLKKHAVSFDEGATIFHDPLIASMSDPDHSENEERYLSIGMSAQGRLLVVVHTQRGERTRLISCRKATSAERKIYENT